MHGQKNVKLHES